jgi:hypothetical protein
LIFFGRVLRGCVPMDYTIPKYVTFAVILFLIVTYVFNRVLELHFSRMKIADHVALYTWMKSKINPTTISGKMLLAGINFT